MNGMHQDLVRKHVNNTCHFIGCPAGPSAVCDFLFCCLPFALVRLDQSAIKIPRADTIPGVWSYSGELCSVCARSWVHYSQENCASRKFLLS
jgi:hypothetical protein